MNQNILFYEWFWVMTSVDTILYPQSSLQLAPRSSYTMFQGAKLLRSAREWVKQVQLASGETGMTSSDLRCCVKFSF